MKRVCIIGAGTAGLCSARHAFAHGMDVTVYETKNIGGTWAYNEKTGKDEYGRDIHSSMYKSLHTNLPKEVMGFLDYNFPEQERSYVPAKDVLDFLNVFADSFDIRRSIKFLHYVIRVIPEESDCWQVIVRDLSHNNVVTEVFDFVIVCNGHYHTPIYAELKGIETFKGKSLHSRDYRTPEFLRDEKVLVIGARSSGMDIANEVSKYAKTVFLSHHLAEKPTTHFPRNLIQKPDVACVNGNQVKFLDETEEEISVIMHCTGYKFTFPFLSIHSGIQVEENYVQPLYKHCININRPTMAIVGLPFYVCASLMIDLQARFVMQFFSGKKKLPSKIDMLRDTNTEMEARWKKGYRKKMAHMMGPHQDKYFDDLSETAGIEKVKPYVSKIMEESRMCFNSNLAHFRKVVFKIIDDETFVKENEVC